MAVKTIIPHQHVWRLPIAKPNNIAKRSVSKQKNCLMQHLNTKIREQIYVIRPKSFMSPIRCVVHMAEWVRILSDPLPIQVCNDVTSNCVNVFIIGAILEPPLDSVFFKVVTVSSDRKASITFLSRSIVSI